MLGLALAESGTLPLTLPYFKSALKVLNVTERTSPAWVTVKANSEAEPI